MEVYHRAPPHTSARICNPVCLRRPDPPSNVARQKAFGSNYQPWQVTLFSKSFTFFFSNISYSWLYWQESLNKTAADVSAINRWWCGRTAGHSFIVPRLSVFLYDYHCAANGITCLFWWFTVNYSKLDVQSVSDGKCYLQCKVCDCVAVGYVWDRASSCKTNFWTEFLKAVWWNCNNSTMTDLIEPYTIFEWKKWRCFRTSAAYERKFVCKIC